MIALDRLIPIETAGRQFNVPYRTLRKRVVDGTIPTYRSDRDRRKTLVAADDIERLFVPRPIEDDQEARSLTPA